MKNWRVDPAVQVSGRVRVPGDKSISHRSVMLGGIAEGRTEVTGFLAGADCLATLAAFQKMGVDVQRLDETSLVVQGRGLHGLAAPADVLDMGNAGTAIRLCMGLLSGQRFQATMTGDASLRSRPMERVAAPLRQMGAQIQTTDGKPPVTVRPAARLAGIDYALPMASAQVKSAVLLAGLFAEGSTTVIEPQPTRDYTERMLAAFGWPITFSPGRASVPGGQRLRATDVHVPADFSSAAFFIVAATLVPGSELRLRRVGMNPRRTGLLHVMQRMGADITVEAVNEQGGEPVADLVVRHAPLHGIEVPVEHVADMIDEFPALFIAAACAEGTTVVRGASELRVKESDRIATMATGLRTLGARIDETPDGAVIHGGARFGAGAVESHGDHRIAMSFAIAAQLAEGEVRVRDVANVATSFPGFDALARESGFGLRQAG